MKVGQRRDSGDTSSSMELTASENQELKNSEVKIHHEERYQQLTICMNQLGHVRPRSLARTQDLRSSGKDELKTLEIWASWTLWMLGLENITTVDSFEMK